jgi:hypothetical protein
MRFAKLYIKGFMEFMLGVLGALYIVTDLLFEFAIEVVEKAIKNALEKC